jgi:hypothetical protein
VEKDKRNGDALSNKETKKKNAGSNQDVNGVRGVKQQ